MNILLAALKIMGEYYPGRLYKAFVIDPPSLFSYLWKVNFKLYYYYYVLYPKTFSYLCKTIILLQSANAPCLDHLQLKSNLVLSFFLLLVGPYILCHFDYVMGWFNFQIM